MTKTERERREMHEREGLSEGSLPCRPTLCRQPAHRPPAPRVHYVCKYTPVEILQAMGADCHLIDETLEGFDRAESLVGSGICGFAKTIIEIALSGSIDALVLVDCCDAIRSVYDVLRDRGDFGFLFMMDLPHCDSACAREQLADECRRLICAFGDYSFASFSEAAFRACFHAAAGENEREREGRGDSKGDSKDDSKGDGEGSGGRTLSMQSVQKPYIAVLGARMGEDLFRRASEALPCELRNATCVGNRSADVGTPPATDKDCEERRRESDRGKRENRENALASDCANGHGDSLDELMTWYAGQLFSQVPCLRMADVSARRALALDPMLAGIVYHTIKFCDFYSFEYAELRESATVPLLKIETDCTTQSSEQVATRLEAFGETIAERLEGGHETMKTKEREASAERGSASRTSPARYFAGIDSGSTSTEVVVMNESRTIVARATTPTGPGATSSAQSCLEEALEAAGLSPADLSSTVATGYGRKTVGDDGASITEISCHARGALFVDPRVRTVIDIGGQDSKVIALSPDGSIANFAMNDKCAAGTGRFLETMARTLQIDLDELAQRGLTCKEEIAISSTCTVFAESEVVGLVAQDKSLDDIVCGLDRAVALRTVALVRRVSGEGPYMMTGGVSRNKGVVKAIEERLGQKLIISPDALWCGAIGAALFARDRANW